ncbi:LytTR family DNA-binding domain-containing protein [Dyadobacter sp. CY312]|uniref:LytR/AlgR family response regulator transcription factor n=1 Tax=Dyadobacter sp. CY312 TaxID=2907303 RepID=UPI001F41D0A9|nr:LytTR family DNA-binding domain-containing protein [Dyadobacter sp. CY312]MCE7044543.1 LytTR family DNA-binding domain-containing protein [Dyadobacter sp. CY312]
MKQSTRKPLRCLIVDDEIAAHKTIKFYISKVPGLEYSQGCMNAVSALEAITTGDFDIIFLDVDMPYISGVEFLKIAGNMTASVIMTTAHARFAIDGFDHNVADFLLKPISLERFLKAVHKVRSLRATQTGWVKQTHEPSLDNLRETLHPFQLLQKNTGTGPETSPAGLVPVFKEKMMWIRVEKSILPVEYNELYMIKGSGNYVQMYTKGKKYLVRTSLTLLLERLPDIFIKTHKSYIINRHLIQTLQGNEIVMSGGKHIAKISRYLRTDVLNKLGPLYG